MLGDEPQELSEVISADIGIVPSKLLLDGISKTIVLDYTIEMNPVSSTPNLLLRSSEEEYKVIGSSSLIRDI